MVGISNLGSWNRHCNIHNHNLETVLGGKNCIKDFEKWWFENEGPLTVPLILHQLHDPATSCYKYIMLVNFTSCYCLLLFMVSDIIKLYRSVSAWYEIPHVVIPSRCSHCRPVAPWQRHCSALGRNGGWHRWHRLNHVAVRRLTSQPVISALMNNSVT